MNNKTIVVDMDGTLANVVHRVSLLHSEKPDWDGFYNRIKDDSVNEWCKELMRAMCAAGHKVVIVSARPQRCLSATRKWLTENEVKYSDIYLLRGAHGDYTPDQELKRKWSNSYGKNKILFVVDDRQKVVDMWRSEGLVCLQCAKWEEFKRAK